MTVLAGQFGWVGAEALVDGGAGINYFPSSTTIQGAVVPGSYTPGNNIANWRINHTVDMPNVVHSGVFAAGQDNPAGLPSLSNTANQRLFGIEDWNGSFEQFTPLPAYNLMPGRVFNFLGIVGQTHLGAPATPASNLSMVFAGTAIINEVVSLYDTEGNVPIRHTYNFQAINRLIPVFNLDLDALVRTSIVEHSGLFHCLGYRVIDNVGPFIRLADVRRTTLTFTSATEEYVSCDTYDAGVNQAGAALGYWNNVSIAGGGGSTQAQYAVYKGRIRGPFDLTLSFDSYPANFTPENINEYIGPNRPFEICLITDRRPQFRHTTPVGDPFQDNPHLRFRWMRLIDHSDYLVDTENNNVISMTTNMGFSGLETENGSSTIGDILGSLSPVSGGVGDDEEISWWGASDVTA